MLDEEWRDNFHKNLGYSASDTDLDGKRHQFMLDSLTERESLHEHLMRQLHLSDLDPKAVRIGEMLVGNINEDGYLGSSPEVPAYVIPEADIVKLESEASGTQRHICFFL